MNLTDLGGCQCGACRYAVNTTPFIAYTCHCRACQKLTASACLACVQVPIEDVSLREGKPSSHVRMADSGNQLQTFFCQSCGSTLYAENSARPRVRTLHIGSLDHPHKVEVQAHIWTSRKLHWVVLPSEHRVYPEAGDWTQDYASDPTRYHS
ncbi:MAG: GFA family protein [Pseudomonadales bacterium]|nr:GFA family protein [Pseudomonadales bacterium]